VTDLGLSVLDVEDSLAEWFQRAAEWGAIILIDDVDVFLEERQATEQRRNALVTGTHYLCGRRQCADHLVFLSCMENYPGMLFLVRLWVASGGILS
jgi:hypothetical protein